MSAQCPFRYPRLYFTAASGKAWVNRKKALSQGRRGGEGRVLLAQRSSPLWGTCPSLLTTKNSGTPIYGSRIRVAPAAATGCRPCRPAASGCRLSLPAAKGTRGACDCSPRPPWISLPLQTRSRGSVLRWIRSCQASFWWSERDKVIPTEPRD